MTPSVHDLDPRPDPLVDTDLLRVLCEPVRVQLLTHLARTGPSDIARIAEAFPQDRSVISRHLQQLERVGVARSEKHARSVLYRVEGAALLGKLEAMVERVRALIAVCCPAAEDASELATPEPPPATSGSSPGSPRRSRPGSFRPSRRRSW